MKNLLIILTLIYTYNINADYRGDNEVLKFLKDGNLSSIRAILVPEATAQATGSRADLERGKFRKTPSGDVAIAVTIEGGGGAATYGAEKQTVIIAAAIPSQVTASTLSEIYSIQCYDSVTNILVITDVRRTSTANVIELLSNSAITLNCYITGTK